ncbi:hypothetical protein NQ284_27810, partial [Escherichia coli]|nr:hypothetical protein [Escherichia coli]
FASVSKGLLLQLTVHALTNYLNVLRTNDVVFGIGTAIYVFLSLFKTQQRKAIVNEVSSEQNEIAL